MDWVLSSQGPAHMGMGLNPAYHVQRAHKEEDIDCHFGRSDQPFVPLLIG